MGCSIYGGRGGRGGASAVLGSNALVVGSGGQYATLALAVADAASGDTIFVQPGVYDIPATVTIPSGVSLIGLGPKITQLSRSGAAHPIATFAGNNQVSGIDFYSSDVSSGGVTFTGTDSVIKDCWIGGAADLINFSATAIAGTIRVENVKLYNTYFDILRVSGGITDTQTIEIVGCQVRSSLADGLQQTGSFFTIQGGSHPNILLENNDIDWRTTDADASMRFFYQVQAANTFRPPLVFSRNNTFKPQTMAGNCRMWELLGNTAPTSAFHALIESHNDQMIARTQTGVVSYLIGNTASGVTVDPGELRMFNGRNVYYVNFPVTAGNWANSTKRITSTGAFTSYTHRAGDYFLPSAGTGVTVDKYLVTARISDDVIEVAKDINGAGTDIADNTIVGILYSQTQAAAGSTANNTRVITT